MQKLKKINLCYKYYIWNPSTCAYEIFINIGKYLESTIDVQ